MIIIMIIANVMIYISYYSVIIDPFHVLRDQGLSLPLIGWICWLCSLCLIQTVNTKALVMSVFCR